MLGSRSLITGGSFVQANGSYTKAENLINIVNDDSRKVGGFERLQMSVASAAFHDSAQRLDPPRCHPHTRDAVLRNIMNWITNTSNRETWMLWLNGAAGAGKSAIAQSIAEICHVMDVPLASFFFFRTDSTRNKIRPVVATLAYQLALSSTEVRDDISSAVERDPLIFNKSFETQFTYLIIEPLQRLRSAISGKYPLVIIIDGLDECNENSAQIGLIRGMASLLGYTELPILFFVASRPEHHLVMAFNSKKVHRVLQRLALDDKYLPDVDIRLFLQDKFSEIKETHPLSDLIDPLWPAQEDVEKLVMKSSGQFIYAAVVINFLSSPVQNPVQRLEIIKGLQPAGKDTPFAQLDTLYRHIFSTVSDLEGALCVLAYSILGNETYTNVIERILSLPEGTVRVTLADLASVLLCKNFVIKYLHASLPDFLLDPVRSQEYYISPGEWNAEFACQWYEDYRLGRVGWINRLTNHLKSAFPTPELRQHILRFQPTTSQMNLFFSKSYAPGDHVRELNNYLLVIKEMAFEDGGEAYKTSLHTIDAFVKKELTASHDVRNNKQAQSRQPAQDDACNNKQAQTHQMPAQEQKPAQKPASAVQTVPKPDEPRQWPTQEQPEVRRRAKLTRLIRRIWCGL